ncbi:MAG: hypothetical protein ACRDPT_10310 [Streptomycetales bacterium]
MRSVARMVGLAILTAAAVVMPAQASWADSFMCSSDGGHACGQWYQDGDNWRLYDEACDGDYVYLVYKQSQTKNDLSNGTRVERHGGCNTNLFINENFPEGAFVNWKVCQNVNLAPDNCSVIHRSTA